MAPPCPSNPFKTASTFPALPSPFSSDFRQFKFTVSQIERQVVRQVEAGMQFGRVVMRQFNCVSLLLLLGVLLAALNPSVAARHRELLAAATTGDQGLDQARAASILTDVDEETTTRRRRVDERLNYRRFGTRKNNPSSHAHFGDRIPFTSDYGRVKRHPPMHN